MYKQKSPRNYLKQKNINPSPSNQSHKTQKTIISKIMGIHPTAIKTAPKNYVKDSL